MNPPVSPPQHVLPPLARATAPSDPDRDAQRRVEEFMHARINFERLPTERYDLQDFKLDRMRMLLARLGDPQQRIPAVHIAGTKGKGSTAAMIAAVLQAAGYRVGLFTSPHIRHFGERMTVDGLLPDGGQLLAALDRVRPVVEEMDRLAPSMRPTFFEAITALAWVHFAGQTVDLAVLEVGLGGRLDATNVCNPVVSVITSISHDHQRLLGQTLPEIAAEKAGIIRPGVPVISGVTQPGPADVIRGISRRQGAPLFELGTEVRFEDTSSQGQQNVAEETCEATRSETARVSHPSPILPSPPRPRGPACATINVTTPWNTHTAVRVPLPGRHQAANAALALAAVDCFGVRRLDAALDGGGSVSESGTVRSESSAVSPHRAFEVTPEVIARGLAGVNWPLRVEVVRERPLTIVDAAHNDASADALLAVLRELDAAHRLLVFATSRDKDVRAVLGRLGPHFDRVLLTRFVNNPRAVPLAELAAVAGELLTVPIETADDPAAAWSRALRLSAPGDLICATGSFFLAAEFRDAVRQSDSREDEG